MKSTAASLLGQSRTQNWLRRTLRGIWIYALYYSGLISWARRRIMASGGILVLTLHRVLDDRALAESNSPAGMIMRRDTFARLLRYLAATGDILALDTSAPNWQPNSPRPRFAITFDDGWKDTAGTAFPLAAEHGLPITVFVCSGLAGQISPFWPETVVGAWRASATSSSAKAHFAAICQEIGSPSRDLDSLLNHLKTLPLRERDRIVAKFAAITTRESSPRADANVDSTMTWEDSARIGERGARIGSHSISHPILTTLPLTEARTELVNSKAAIEAQLGCECALFAYPNGSCSQEICSLAAQAGYARAFVNRAGVWTPGTNPWMIPRINLWEGSVTGPTGKFSSAVFEYNAFWKSFRHAGK